MTIFRFLNPLASVVWYFSQLSIFIQLCNASVLPWLDVGVIGCIGVARGAYGASPQFLEHIVILYFERRYPKQNSALFA